MGEIETATSMEVRVVAGEECDLYLRMSQDNEAGIDRQESECRLYAERLGFVVRRVYTDNKKSATRDDVKREAFEQILTDAAAARKASSAHYTRVVCWHSDRFARRVKDLLRVQEAGILVYGKESGYFDLSQPAGVATAITVTAWAEYEGKQKAARQRAAHRQRASDGRPFWTNHRPFGLNMDGTLLEAEATALREVYRRILAGASLNSCATYLNDLGLTTVRGGEWKGNVLKTVLAHARNAGILTYQGVEVGPGNWSPIVDEETYRATVRLLTDPSRLSSGSRKGQGGRESIMPGFARCSVCGDTVTAYRNRQAKGGAYRLYRCRAGHASARADFVDDHAAALIAERVTRGDVVGRLVGDETVDVEELRAELERLREKGREYEQALDNDDMTMLQFTSLNRKNRERMTAVERELASATMGNATAALLDVGDFVAHWENELNVHEKHAIVSQFFDRIEIEPRGKGVERLAPGKVAYWIHGEAEARRVG